MDDFRYCLNTSTIRPSSLPEKIRMAALAGYDAIELWINDVEEFLAQGNALGDVVKRLDDAELQRPSMISLRNWIVAGQNQFVVARDICERQLALAAGLGVERIVAGPPHEPVELSLAIDRYSEILELSSRMGVPASVEFLGFAATINSLEIAWRICAGVDDSAATITADAWHLFRGESRIETLDEIPPERISIFHWNDAPARPERAAQTDADRVFPGDGILDLAGLANRLHQKGWRGYLSLELFNAEYWKRDPLAVAREGLDKMRKSVSSGEGKSARKDRSA